MHKMTQTIWDSLTPDERAKMRSTEGLTKQLIGLEGRRVEVVTTYGEKRRFIVGRSTGWVPCHIERKLRTSSGGMAAEREYTSIRDLGLAVGPR
jgi:hypothetical protein